MIRTCPKCRDFYADDSLLFCLADGTPLVAVEPRDELWSEAQRAVEEKENARRKKERRLKWRRVTLSSMTVMIVVAVIFVVTVNGIIYLKPQTEDESARAESSTPAVPDSPDVSFIPGKPSPQQQPEAWSRPSPSPTSTVITKPTPTPTPRTILSATPTPTPLVDSTPSEPAQTATCTEAYKRLEMEAIVKSFGAAWRRSIEGERERVIAETTQGVRQGVEASLGALEYTSSFFKECKASVVTVRYAWQLRINVNGTVRVVSVPKERRFACMKIGGAWLCR